MQKHHHENHVTQPTQESPIFSFSASTITTCNVLKYPSIYKLTYQLLITKQKTKNKKNSNLTTYLNNRSFHISHYLPQT